MSTSTQSGTPQISIDEAVGSAKNTAEGSLGVPEKAAAKFADSSAEGSSGSPPRARLRGRSRDRHKSNGDTARGEPMNLTDLKRKSTQDLIDIVQRQAPGTWLPLTVRRGEDSHEIVARFPTSFAEPE